MAFYETIDNKVQNLLNTNNFKAGIRHPRPEMVVISKRLKTER